MVGRLLKFCLVTLAIAVFGGITTIQTAFAQSNNGNGPNPGGNNGFVKVNDQDLDSTPNNDPHVACQFKLEFYNYDQNNTNADVQFELQAPTDTPSHSLTVTGGNLQPFIGADPAGGSNDLDAVETYTLGFTGTPQPNQGYHVKLTINAPGTNGSDVKHKTFWVEPCVQPQQEVAPQLSVVSTCEQVDESDGTATVTVTNPNDDPFTYTVTLNGSSQNVTVNGHDSEDVSFTGLQAGTYTVTAVHGNYNASADVLVETCAPTSQNPMVAAQPGACVAANATNGVITVEVTNPNSYDVNYSVTLDGTTKSLSLAANASGTLTFDNLAAGTYSVEVTGDDDTSATAEATLVTCSAADCTQDCGGRGGDSTPPVVVTPAAPTQPPATPTPSVPLAAQLANTGFPLLSPAFASAIIVIAVWTARYKRPKVATQSAN